MNTDLAKRMALFCFYSGPLSTLGVFFSHAHLTTQVVAPRVAHEVWFYEESVVRMYCAASSLVSVLLALFLSVVVANHNNIPYVAFSGQTLVNHSYVDLSLVGSDPSGSDTVQCHTDLNTCCSGAVGSHRGDWYFPNGTKLPFSGDIYENRRGHRVDLHHRGGVTLLGGIYRCDIPTNAVHSYNYDNYNSIRESVYVGLYSGSGGKIYTSPRI